MERTACLSGAGIRQGDVYKRQAEVIAAVAPAFVGQFGPSVTPDKVKGALKELGFADVVEVAIGADQMCIRDSSSPHLMLFSLPSCFNFLIRTK